ncbi:hypothetical protein [Actinoplanes sp. NPDC051859]|uniref:hypothetical protein n=1 Tax=Actinoplanes sp. NPDC051859 TaxID=3363909 RepID=UPI0037B3D8AD
MDQPVSQMNVPALGRMGADVRAAADAFGRAHADSGRLAGAAALSGWPAARAVTGAEQVWAGFLKQLSGQVRQLGDGLAQAASDYQAADEHAADQVTGAGRLPR